jgi:hypothetical protein
MKTRICRQFEWMRPYLKIGMRFIHPHRIGRIGSWSLGKRYGFGEFAAILQDAPGEPHRIWIHTHYYEGTTPKRFSRIDLLKLLAHELAHTMDWKHTPLHERITSQITIAFMAQLKKEGYVSEESEFNDLS